MAKARYQFTPEQEKWLVDLETTEEPQYFEGGLHLLPEPGVHAGGWCCLGRGAKTLGLPEGTRGRLGVFCAGTERLTSWLPASAVAALRLRGTCGEFRRYVAVGEETYGSLASLNDDAKWSFKQIAAYIRANPRNVFTEEPAHVD